MNYLDLFSKKKAGKNFFELPSKEKKRIISKAVRGSNELQKELSIKYDKLVLNKAF